MFLPENRASGFRHSRTLHDDLHLATSLCTIYYEGRVFPILQSCAKFIYQCRVDRMTKLFVPTTVTEDGVLQLPLDFYRTPSTTGEPAVYPLANTVNDCSDYHTLAAAWCILLSRHVTELETPLQRLKILLNSVNTPMQCLSFTKNETSVNSLRSEAREGKSKYPFDEKEPFDLLNGNEYNSFQSRWSCVPAGEAVCGSEILLALKHLLENPTDDKPSPQEQPPVEGNRGALTVIPYDSRIYSSIMEQGSPEAVLKLLSAFDPHTDINLVIICKGRELFDALIVYNAQLFLKSTIERCAKHLQVLHKQLNNAPDSFITDFQLLTSEEQTWLNKIARGPDRPTATPALYKQFEYHSDQSPHSIALRYRDQKLSYLEVNERANRLAHYLIEQGIGAEKRVIMCLEPSFDPIVALLAIWKAGGCYIPLDPGYPTARIKAIIEETQPDLIITRRELARKHDLTGLSILAIDEVTEVIASRSVANPGVIAMPETTASIFFTSGTTGRPKGVMGSNINIAHYINVAREQYSVTANDILPAIARFDFSISIFELMLPITTGGTLIVLDREHVINFSRISRTLEEVTFFHMGPSLLKGVIAYIRQNISDVSIYSKVRHASSGGDMIPPEVLENLKQIFTEAQIFVIYGCSEISCMGCTYPVSRTEIMRKTYVGRPFQNVTVRILDKRRRMLPVGISGEICFAGEGVVKGYLNQPDLTSERFVNIHDERFYCTGDIGRLNNDGIIEILGRRDFQVQLRGMRVDLGEVEYALRQAPGVQDGIVIARTTSEGEKQLVAFIVPKDDGISPAPRKMAIRAFMTDNLPDYMVPATYTELSALPLNLNMKVDRRALQKMAVPLLQSDSNFRNPESPAEKEIAALWSSLLNVENIGLDNNFFELGGDSLQALNFIDLIQQQYGVTLEGMDVLRESLEVLARICDQHSGHIVAARQSQPASVITETKELFYFGPDSSLFGVLTTPATVATESTAVLICCANGHENIRTTFIIQNLTKQITEFGFPVFRFDYFGCRDALGESKETTCSRWQQDINSAQNELRYRTGAENVIAIGIRFGATLLLNSSERNNFSKLVLWDPIMKGDTYFKELQILHKAYLDAQTHLRWTPRIFRAPGYHELLGSCYSEKMIQEFHSISIQPELCKGIVTHWLLTDNSISEECARPFLSHNPLNQIISLSKDCFWQDPAAIEEILPDNGISKALTTLIKGA